MKRGDVFEARLDPTEGSEQAGTRPVVVIVPCTTYRAARRIYPSPVRLRAPEGGLKVDSIALGEQVRAIAKTRLAKRWGTLSPEALRRIERALSITLDLPGQDLV